MDEELKLKLTTEFSGQADMAQYAAALENVAKAEGRLSRASRAAAKNQAEANKVREEAMKSAASAPANNYATAPTMRYSGPFTRLSQVQSALESARSKGESGDKIRDLEYSLRLAQRRAAQVSGEDETDKHQALGQAILSTRFNAGPFSPLLGRALRAGARYVKAAATPENLEKLQQLPGGKGLASILAGASEGSVATIVGRLVASPAGVAGAALLGLAKVTKQVYDAEFTRAQKGAELTDKIAQQAAAFGSGGAGRGNVLGGYLGVDSGSAAFGFQQRIASDPLARASAARLGIADLASPYGSLDPGKKYLEAIKKLSEEGDEAVRRRTARILGIEKEVERYRLLSADTKQALDRQGGLSGMVNDKLQQRNAAEFDAAQERLANAKELFDIARQKGSLPDAVRGMNREAAAYESATKKMEGVRRSQREQYPTLDWQKEVSGAFWDRIAKSDLSAQEKRNLRHQLQTLPSNDMDEARRIVDQRLGGGDDIARNTQATEKLTQVMMRLDKNIGATAKSQEAFGKLQGGNLFDAWAMGALRAGAF